MKLEIKGNKHKTGEEFRQRVSKRETKRNRIENAKERKQKIISKYMYKACCCIKLGMIRKVVGRKKQK